MSAANIPLEIIPCDLTKAESFSVPLLPPIPNIAPELLIAPVESGIFELPVTALSEFARCPQRFQFNYLAGHPGVTEGVAYSVEVGTLVHTALEHNIKNASSLLPFCDLSGDTAV